MTDVHNPELDICSTCGNTRTWHRSNGPRHAFTPPGSIAALRDVSDDQEAPTAESGARTRIQHTRTPFDPVLRLALIENGVITIQQLADAERKLSFVSQGLGEDYGN